MYQLPPISERQARIVADLRKGRNVKDEAIAGSGKTASILHIAKEMRSMKILTLTYNKSLQVETQAKVKTLKEKYKIDFEIYTFHGSCSKIYKRVAMNDAMLESIVKDPDLENHNLGYDIVIVDEAQDMTILFYLLVTLIVKTNSKIPQICLIGDSGQMINEYRGASSRFLENPEIYFCNGLPWKTRKLDVSFRITNHMSGFLNTCINEDKRPFEHIDACKEGRRVQYLICDPYRDIVKHIFEVLGKGYEQGDILILAPTVNANSRNPLKVIENALVRSKFSIARVRNDQEIFDDSGLVGRIAIMTFNASKGLQRPVVFVMGFDDSYEEFYLRSTTDKCPNILYVAMTRSSNLLYLCHSNRRGFLKMLKLDVMEKSEHVKMIGACQNVSPIRTMAGHFHRNWSVTNLIQHVPYTTIRWCFERFETIVWKEASKPYKITIGINLERNGVQFVENVSSINGIAIIAAYEYKMTGKISIIDNFEEILEAILYDQFSARYPPEAIKGMKKSLRLFRSGDLSINEFLFFANIWMIVQNGYIDGFYNLGSEPDKYDWIEEKDVKRLLKRIKDVIGEDDGGVFEKRYSEQHLSGVVDYITDTAIYEFKCKSEISDIDHLQLIIYSYLVEIIEGRKRQLYLYNVLTDELLEIVVSSRHAESILQRILHVRSVECKECSGCQGSCDYYYDVSRIGSMCEDRFLAMIRGQLSNSFVENKFTEKELAEITKELVTNVSIHEYERMRKYHLLNPDFIMDPIIYGDLKDPEPIRIEDNLDEEYLD